MNFALQIWFTVVSMFCQSHLNLSAPPQFLPDEWCAPHFEMSSNATESDVLQRPEFR